MVVGGSIVSFKIEDVDADLWSINGVIYQKNVYILRVDDFNRVSIINKFNNESLLRQPRLITEFVDEFNSSFSDLESLTSYINDILVKKCCGEENALIDDTTPSLDTTYSSVKIEELLDEKEDLVNKQNSLAIDGTGTKYPTVDAINLALSAIPGQTENFNWKFNNSTVASDPGVGFFRTNNATASLVTEIYVDDICDQSGLDISNVIGNINGTWRVYVQQTNDSTKFATYVTNGPYTDNTGWWTIPVTYEQSGAGGALTNNTRCTFYFINHNNVTPADVVPPTRTININGVVQDLSVDRQWRTGMSDTGVLTYGGATIAGLTTINVGPVTGIITDNETNPNAPTYTLVTYPGGTGITVPTIGAGTGTYLLLDNTGSLVFQNTFPTSAQRKSMIWLSKISHPNLASISFVIDEVDFVASPIQQFRDFFQAINYMNLGVSATGNPGLTINTTNGFVLGNGINFVTDKTMPNHYPVPSGSPTSFLLLNQSGPTGGFVTTLDPNNYDVAGVTTPVGGSVNSSTIQYLYYAPGVGYAIQRGQTVYASLIDAIAAVGKESFNIRPNLINNSILVAVICLRRTTIDMNDVAFARVFQADKFGQIGGSASGVSVTSLQTAYNNSTIPQILTSDSLGAVTVRRGSAADTDIVAQYQNGAGGIVWTIDGNGNVSDVPQITITTGVSISTLTTDSAGRTQNGRNVVIANGASAINYTCNGTDGFVISIVKTGSAAITFVAGAGRTIVQMNGTLSLNGIAGSVASISSVGTVDYLYITNY